tara:strand:+ start:489 stop:599 length:111 start_codon:yes stop_codon:yes gene_type:complete
MVLEDWRRGRKRYKKMEKNKRRSFVSIQDIKQFNEI